jgi:hypothetical protein
VETFFNLKNTNVMICLSIFGDDFEPELVSKRLDITPTDFWYKGDISKKYGMIKRETVWELSTEYEESLDVNVQLDYILDMIEPKKELLVKIKQEFNSETPGLYLDKKSIDLIHYIGAEIDMDLYA